jgi:hypothetical protein
MTNTVLPITPIITRACDLLEDFVGKFIGVCRETLPPRTYEAEVEALNLFKMAVRNVEGVIELARRDLALLPPAFAAARACFECAVRASWLVDADDPFEREARYLAHLASEENDLNRVAGRLRDPQIVTRLREREKVIRDFRLAISNKLPPRIRKPAKVPKFDRMLASLGGENIYSLYILLSQSVHGGHAATWLYRKRGLGTERLIGEFIRPTEWQIPFRVTFFSLSRPGYIFLSRCGGDPDRLLDQETVRRLEGQIDEVGKDDCWQHF